MNTYSPFHFTTTQNDTVAGDVTRKIEECKSRKKLSTGTLVHTLMLVAEEIVVTKFRKMNILNAVICSLLSYFTFLMKNMHFLVRSNTVYFRVSIFIYIVL